MCIFLRWVVWAMRPHGIGNRSPCSRMVVNYRNPGIFSLAYILRVCALITGYIISDACQKAAQHNTVDDHGISRWRHQVIQQWYSTGTDRHSATRPSSHGKNAGQQLITEEPRVLLPKEGCHSHFAENPSLHVSSRRIVYVRHSRAGAVSNDKC